MAQASQFGYCACAWYSPEDRWTMQRRAIRRAALVLALHWMAGASVLAQGLPTPGEFVRNIILEQPSPLATNSLLMQRLLSPRQRERQLADLSAKHQGLAEFPLIIGAERFSIYLPRRQPAGGYGLLVFIPPWDDGRLPAGWARQLDQAGMIFVSAERSGNDQNIQRRRIPLALTAAHAFATSYAIDTQRTYIGGFSGGSRVALRVALAYPDIFIGALLNSGSDAVGNVYYPLPSSDLMTLLQNRTRWVFVTGENDDINLSQDAIARKSLSSWCMDNTRAVTRSHMGHDIMDGAALAEALGALERAHRSDPADSRCRATMGARLRNARLEAANLRTEQCSSRSRERLDQLDGEYGALLEDDAALAPKAPQ